MPANVGQAFRLSGQFGRSAYNLIFFVNRSIIVPPTSGGSRGGGGAESAAAPPPFRPSFGVFLGGFLLFSGAASRNLDSRPTPPPPLFTDPGSASALRIYSSEVVRIDTFAIRSPFVPAIRYSVTEPLLKNK